MEKTIDHFGRLDGLVNNASVFATSLDEVNDQNWNDLIGTNLKAPLLLAQAAARVTAQSWRHSNIVDIHAERPMHGHLLYNIAKGGSTHTGSGTGAGTASPRQCDFSRRRVWPENAEWGNETLRRQIIGQTLLKREGEPEDIAYGIILLNDAPILPDKLFR